MSGTLPAIVEAGGVRKFEGSQLQASIDRALAGLPDTKRAAVVDVGADRDGIVAVAVVKLNDDWSVVGSLERRFSGEWSGHAQIRWSR